jgi:putative phosphotransacetylase
MASPPLPSRAAVEQLVRQAVYARLRPGGNRGPQPHPLMVSVSARHCHVTQEALEALFGKGHQLTVHKPLYQTGHFAANETVTIIGPRSRMISNLRILGPVRPYTQVELSFTDGIALGFDLPHRISGDVNGTLSAMLMGPAGYYEMREGVIRAMRHVHMGPGDAEYYGVKAGDQMKLNIGGDAPVTLNRMLVRLDPNSKLEVHIDTDEGNACHLTKDTPVELVK